MWAHDATLNPRRPYPGFATEFEAAKVRMPKSGADMVAMLTNLYVSAFWEGYGMGYDDGQEYAANYEPMAEAWRE